jgi:hypothetical protein
VKIGSIHYYFNAKGFIFYLPQGLDIIVLDSYKLNRGRILPIPRESKFPGISLPNLEVLPKKKKKNPRSVLTIIPCAAVFLQWKMTGMVVIGSLAPLGYVLLLIVHHCILFIISHSAWHLIRAQ